LIRLAITVKHVAASNTNVKDSVNVDEKVEELEEVPVSCTDELVTSGDSKQDRVRRAGEYWPSNAPLSAVEERKRIHGWVRRTIENIEDLQPLLER
jgi:hypothetical protein